MKKIAITLTALALASGCASIDTTKVNGAEVITSTRMAPVIFGIMGAPTSQCLADLQDNGVTKVVSVMGANENGPLLSRISGLEGCQATGTK